MEPLRASRIGQVVQMAANKLSAATTLSFSAIGDCQKLSQRLTLSTA
jgi:hypothetical protein